MDEVIQRLRAMHKRGLKEWSGVQVGVLFGYIDALEKLPRSLASRFKVAESTVEKWAREGATPHPAVQDSVMRAMQEYLGGFFAETTRNIVAKGDTTAWMIEFGNPALALGRCGKHLKTVCFTSDQALRFKTKEEAETFVLANAVSGARICEHMFVGDTTQDVTDKTQGGT